MHPHAEDQFAIRRMNAQQGYDDTRERIFAMPEGFGTSLYQPDTPRTTISAVLKNCAAPGEDFTVSVPQNHVNSEPQINRKKLCLFSTPASDSKQESAIKRVLKNFSSGKKRSKSNAAERSPNFSFEGRRTPTAVSRVQSTASSSRREEDDDFGNKFQYAPETSSHTVTHPCDYRGISQTHHPQACSSLFPQDRLSPIGSTASHAIIFGSQVPYSGHNRLLSTYNLTPTNAGSYAVSGRSRLVSGRFVSSHHADVQGAEAALPVPTSRTPTIRPRLTAPDSPTPQSTGRIIPRPFLVVDSTPISTHSDDAQQPAVEMRRSVSVPINLTTTSTPEFIRTSAVPPPLRVRGDHHIQQQQLKLPVYQNTDTATTHPPVATTEQLTHRLDKLEHKLDRVLNLLLTLTGPSSTSHTTTPTLTTPPTQSTSIPHKSRRRRERTRSIRANLTGLPPHIPYGGSQGGGADLQGWYDAVTAENAHE